MDKEKKKYTNTKGPGSPIETPFKHGDTRLIKINEEKPFEEVILSDEESLLKK